MSEEEAMAESFFISGVLFYCNQQRFLNATEKALTALGEQLDATGRMALVSRIVLDMLLAEEEGVK